MSRMLITLLTFTCLFCNFAFAAPSINSISGTAAHNLSITINGANFGSKSPAPPLWWDDGEGATLNNKSILKSSQLSWVVSGTLSGSNQHYIDAWPRSVSEGGGAANMQYRSIPYRNVSAPHQYSSVFLTGGHDDQGECAGGAPGQNVGITVGPNVPNSNTRSEQWYLSYYRRLDPLFPQTSGTMHNYKDLNWEAYQTFTMYDGGSNNYEATNCCSGGVTGDCRSPACGAAWHSMSQVYVLGPDCGGTNFYPVITFDRNVPNFYDQWVRTDRVLDLAGDIYHVSNDNVRYIDSDQDASCDIRPANMESGQTGFGAVSIGGYYRHTTCGGTAPDLDDNAFRYYDDIYVDTTLSRVMLCDTATYPTVSTATCEPQIPITWNNNSISATVNLGKLPNQGTAYLFIFDANNNHNTTGYPVTISGGGGGGDSDPPAPPTGLRVE